MAQTQLSKEMTREQFTTMFEETWSLMQTTGLPTPKEKVYEGLINRFAQLHGVTVEEAEKILDGPTEAAPLPEPEPDKPETKKKRAEVMQSLASIQQSDKFFWEAPQEVAYVNLLIDLRVKAGLNTNLLVTGPSGSGKTESIQEAARRANIPFYKVDCSSITTAEKWLGHKEIDDKGTHYVMSEHVKWLGGIDCEPGLLLYDEINRLHPALHNVLFPILDGYREIWVPELGTHIQVHPSTVIMATANLGAGYTGTHRMDDALQGRFGYRMERKWPPKAQEITILTKRMGIDAATATILVDIAQQTRDKNRNGDLDLPVSTRDLLNTSALIAAGQSILQAASYTFLLYYSEDGGTGSQRTIVNQIVQGKAAGR